MNTPGDPAGEQVRRTTLAWHAGWAAARGYDATTDADGVVTTVVGDQHREVELLLPGPTVSSGVLDRAAHAVLSHRLAWVSVVTLDAAATCERLRERGLLVLASQECLMARGLADHPRPAFHGDTTAQLAEEQHAVRLRATTAGGDLAASGQVGLVGPVAVADKILTEPEHRRRGLASAVMGALVDAAVARGARDGLLVASPEGRLLYARLGWRRVADLVIGSRPA